MNKQNVMVVGGVAMVAGITGASAQENSALFEVGSVDVRPRASYSVVYDDNIFLEHKSKAIGTTGKPGRDHDFTHIITPGIRLNAGDTGARQSAYFDANYDVVFTRFSKNTGSAATDHNASIELGGTFNKLSLSLAQNLASRSDADVRNLAANGRVKRRTWGTRLGAEYEISEKTSASLDLAQTIGDYSAPLVDSVDRSANLWLDYQVLPKVRMGIGGGAGYLQVDGTPGSVTVPASHNPNTAYYEGLVRLDWKATEKVSINANGGVQYRNVQEVGAADPLGLVFAVGATWKAAERTTLTVQGARNRRVSNAIGAQINEETSVTAALAHSLMDRVGFGLDGGYTHSHYDGTTRVGAGNVPGGSGLVRDDHYFFVRPSLSYKFMERAQARVFYQYRRNDSNLSLNANDFYNTQVGLEVSYRF